MTRIARSVLPWLAERYLYLRKREQKGKYQSLTEQAIQNYRALLTGDISKFCAPAWLSRATEAERSFVPRPKFSFLREGFIQRTMVLVSWGRWVNQELQFLESRYTSRHLRKLLIEDYVGMPIIRSARYLTSATSVHHLYHVVFFEREAGISVKEVNSVIEWGGGYGNMAKIIRRMSPSLTYTIIDIPMFSCIQWLYLCTVFDPAEVNIIRAPGTEILRGKINILPLNLIEQHQLDCELFVGTWSLSESSALAQDYVFDHDFFAANRLLLAFQDSSETWPNAGRVGELAANRGASIKPIDFLPGNYYALR